MIGQIKRNLLVNKPHLIHVIQHIEKNISRSQANRIIKQMIMDRKIDEHLALNKRERPYSFYTLKTASANLAEILSPLLEGLDKEKKLSIKDALRITGYTPLLIRTLFSHLLLEGKVDYYGDLDSPVFYKPWDVE